MYMIRKVRNMPKIEIMCIPYKMFILLKSVLSRKVSFNKNALNQERESVHWWDFGKKWKFLNSVINLKTVLKARNPQVLSLT